MMPASDFSDGIREEASHYLKQGPLAWDQHQIDKERFLITDVLDDILTPKSHDEQIASASWLFEALAQFYFRAQNKWCASGKSIIRYLQQDDPDLAREFSESFHHVFTAGDAARLKKLVEKILQPYGGLFWDGYYSDAPADAKMPEIQRLLDEKIVMKQEHQMIYELETSLLNPETRKSIEQLKRLIADEFIEYGASGLIYNKKDLLILFPKKSHRAIRLRVFQF